MRPEAVKAQAVAARTYAYVEYLDMGYVNDDTRDICYKGYAYESSNPGAAAGRRRHRYGKILKYGTTYYKAYFSSHSGGYTSATAWSDSPPSYVVSKPDPWSLAAPTGHPTIQPGYPWKVVISPANLVTKLRGGTTKYIDDVGTITKVEIISRDTSDPGSHAKQLRITGTTGF